MLCPRCDGKTSVCDSRVSKTGKKHSHLVNAAHEVIGWYCSDFVARQRVCRSCGYRFKTAEMLIDDMADICTSIREETVASVPKTRAAFDLTRRKINILIDMLEKTAIGDNDEEG